MAARRSTCGPDREEREIRTPVLFFTMREDDTEILRDRLSS